MLLNDKFDSENFDCSIPFFQVVICVYVGYTLYCMPVNCSSYNFSADGFSALTASLCGVPLSARSNVDWMRKLAFRYRRIRDLYAANCTNVTGNIAGV